MGNQNQNPNRQKPSEEAMQAASILMMMDSGVPAASMAAMAKLQRPDLILSAALKTPAEAMQMLIDDDQAAAVIRGREAELRAYITQFLVTCRRMAREAGHDVPEPKEIELQ